MMSMFICMAASVVAYMILLLSESPRLANELGRGRISYFLVRNYYRYSFGPRNK